MRSFAFQLTHVDDEDNQTEDDVRREAHRQRPVVEPVGRVKKERARCGVREMGDKEVTVGMVYLSSTFGYAQLIPTLTAIHATTATRYSARYPR